MKKFYINVSKRDKEIVVKDFGTYLIYDIDWVGAMTKVIYHFRNMYQDRKEDNIFFTIQKEEQVNKQKIIDLYDSLQVN